MQEMADVYIYARKREKEITVGGGHGGTAAEEGTHIKTDRETGRGEERGIERGVEGELSREIREKNKDIARKMIRDTVTCIVINVPMFQLLNVSDIFYVSLLIFSAMF